MIGNADVLMVMVMQGAKVAEHLEHPRQFSVITASRTCYLRVKDREKRGYWVKAIQACHPCSVSFHNWNRSSRNPHTPQSAYA